MFRCDTGKHQAKIIFENINRDDYKISLRVLVCDDLVVNKDMSRINIWPGTDVYDFFCIEKNRTHTWNCIIEKNAYDQLPKVYSISTDQQC